MKIKGTKVLGPGIRVVPLFKGEQKFIFKVGAIVDFSEFMAILPEPKPKPMLKDGVQTTTTDHPGYKEEFNKYQIAKSNWMIWKSISFTDDLEWETVKDNDPESWKNYSTELIDAGFTPSQIVYLSTEALKVNTIDEDRMTEARAHFLASQQAPQGT